MAWANRHATTSLIARACASSETPFLVEEIIQARTNVFVAPPSTSF
jgi:hypothetical protein